MQRREFQWRGSVNWRSERERGERGREMNDGANGKWKGEGRGKGKGR